MRIIGRPLAVCCAVFMIFCAAGCFFSEYIIYIAAAVGALSLLSLFMFILMRQKSHKRVALLLVLSSLFSLAGLLISYMSFVQREKEISVYYNCEVNVTAYCTSVVSRNSFSSRYTAETISIDGREESIGILLVASGDKIDVGDVFCAKVIISALSKDDAGFDEHAVWTGKGIEVIAETCKETIITVMPEKKEILGWLDRIRSKTTDTFKSLLDDRSVSFFSAVFAGDRSYMSDSDTLSVRRSGTSHLLAVSGMHFSVIMGMAYFFVRSIGLRIKSRYLALAVIAVVYAGFTGFSAPVIRSGIMLLLTYGGAVVGKRTDPLTSLLCAGAVMIAFCPYYIYSPSFWLSFSATLGVVLFSSALGELFEHRHNQVLGDILRDPALDMRCRIFTFVSQWARESMRAIPAFLVGAIMVSVAATAFSMPFGVLFFGSVSYVSIPAGIVLSPIVTVSLILSPLILLLGKFSPISALADIFGEAFFTITNFFSDINGVYRNVDYFAAKLSLLLFLLTALVIMLFTKKKIYSLVVCAIAVISVFFISYVAENAEFAVECAVVTCAGDNDSIALRAESGLVVADMGSDGARDIDESLISVSELKENEISAYIFTDLCSKQEGVVRYLLANYYVGCVYLPDYAAPDMKVIADAARAEAERAGVRVEYFRFGEEFAVDEYTLCVSELEFLDRSVKALYSVSVESEKGSFLWVSSSYFEGEKCRSLGGNYYDRVIFGSYGPKCKDKIADVYDLVKCSEFIACTQEVEALVRPERGKGKDVPFLVSASVKFGFSVGNTKKIS